MKILAVIPARAGSKGIPNKNIRIINGRPLIYYSIKNAMNSKYITDVIVTTDSEEIKLISKQMKVNYKNRDPELCQDNITLDSVIYDAIPKDEEWDYIITMQPTSPTLKVETLDKAIKYAVDNDLDTLISAINAPHLTWGLKDGKVVPNYKERLNRQYLPPCYFETGAFVISKFRVVTPNTRIGKKVSVYEISEDEAIDVDNFEDLRNVSDALTAHKVGFFVNGNNTMGTGHVYRVLELADEFYCKPDIYYDKNITNKKIFGNTTHNLIGVNGIDELLKKCKKEKYTLFINDTLATEVSYMEKLRETSDSIKIINFEDDSLGASKADASINALYAKSDQKNTYFGEKYYICPKTFMFYNKIDINDKVKNILVTFGGADPQNYTDRILKIISKKEYNNYNFIVILGRAKKNIETLMKYDRYKNIKMLHDVKNIAEIMSNTDIAITSRGRTGYELATLGVPTIAMAQNKREEKHTFISNENGFSYIGLNPTDEMIEGTLKIYLKLSKKSRLDLQNKLLHFDLKNGRKAIMGIINNL